MVWNLYFLDERSKSYGMHYTAFNADGDRVERPGSELKAEYIDRTPDRGTVGGGFNPGELNLGRAIKSVNLPSRIRIDSKPFDHPDAKTTLNLFHFVSDRFRQVVEALEPGRHQFFPVPFEWKDGSFAFDMFIFNVCARLDSVDREHTTLEMPNGITWKPWGGKLVFSDRQIGEHHYWIDRHMSRGNNLFCSDAAYDAMSDAGLTGIKANHFPSSPMESRDGAASP